MGKVSWFLGRKYGWETLPDGRFTASITQTAKIEELVDSHGVSDCNPVPSPYRSSFAIDHIPADNIPIEDKLILVKKYQSLVGGMLWVQAYTSCAATYFIIGNHLSADLPVLSEVDHWFSEQWFPKTSTPSKLVSKLQPIVVPLLPNMVNSTPSLSHQNHFQEKVRLLMQLPRAQLATPRFFYLS
jgi:hypothetical protein